MKLPAKRHGTCVLSWLKIWAALVVPIRTTWTSWYSPTGILHTTFHCWNSTPESVWIYGNSSRVYQSLCSFGNSGLIREGCILINCWTTQTSSMTSVIVFAQILWNSAGRFLSSGSSYSILIALIQTQFWPYRYRDKCMGLSADIDVHRPLGWILGCPNRRTSTRRQRRPNHTSE